MKCPFCNTEMLHGYLNVGNAIWSERKHKISTNPDAKERYALALSVPMMSPHHIESDCCPKCKHIILKVIAALSANTSLSTVRNMTIIWNDAARYGGEV